MTTFDLTSHRGPNGRSLSSDDFEFRCAADDCTEVGHNAEDFLKCDSCNALLCMAHKHSPEGRPYFHFCAVCFRCKCGELAAVMCEECGELICRAHAEKIQEPVDDWNLGDAHYYCAGICQTANTRKPVANEILSEKREVM